MADLFHAVQLDKDLCKGCINCIKRCPTQAIRVREGKAHITPELCIDCGECIRQCPHHAKKAVTDSLSVVRRFAYPIALVPPSFYAQFNNLDDPDLVAFALKKLGFQEVYDVGRAAELVSEATRQMMAAGRLKKPVISSACPAIVRLIRVRFPGLIKRVLPLVAPVELAAQLAKDAAIHAGVPQGDIGCVFLTPCPAKVTAIRTPIGTHQSMADAAVAVKDIYPLMLSAMKLPQDTPQPPRVCGRIGMGWAESGGEAVGLLSTDAYLAADGIENVMRVLEDLEDDKYSGLDFVELNACSGGCVGGVLQVENPYISKAKLSKLRRYMPVSVSRLEDGIPKPMHWSESLEYLPAMELGKTKAENFALYAKATEILQMLPLIDCGSCGAPTCAAFAEDIVRGSACLDGCVVLLRQKMEALLREQGLLANSSCEEDREGIEEICHENE